MVDAVDSKSIIFGCGSSSLPRGTTFHRVGEKGEIWHHKNHVFRIFMFLDWKKHYEKMLLVRRFEEKASEAYGLRKIGGFCHLYIGQEAVAAGVYGAMQPQDSWITAYRDHGHMLICGMDPKEVMAELYGKATGSSRGKGGSMHMFSREKKFFGGHGIVGAQVPLGTGLAFAHKYNEDQGVCVTFMGDGAANQGQVYESFNIAALWNLPVLYIIENNGYGMGTSVARACAGSLHRRGEGYNIPGQQVDGMKIDQVYQAVEKILPKVRQGQPHIIEVQTYRYRGHSMSDPAKYRPEGELSTYKTERDPLAYALAQMEAQGTFKDVSTWKKEVDKSIRTQVKEAVAFAEDSAFPSADTLMTDIYKRTL